MNADDLGPLFAVAGVCYICERPVHHDHEKDHFPTPEADGGTLTLTICRECHDRKDRSALYKWDASEAMSALMGLWSKATSSERLLLGKMFHIMGMVMRASEGRIGSANHKSKRAQKTAAKAKRRAAQAMDQ